MSNLLKDFLANRPGKQPVTNEAQPVTREEFGRLVQVVEALVEDVQIATSPEKLTEAMNAAVKPLLAGLQTNASGVRGQFRAPLALPADGEGLGAEMRANGRRDRGYILPADDGARKPLALKADRGFIAPEGD